MTTAEVLTERHVDLIKEDLLNEVVIQPSYHGPEREIELELKTRQVTISCDDWVPRRILAEKDLDNGRAHISLEFTLSNTDPLAITRGEFTFDVEIVE